MEYLTTKEIMVIHSRLAHHLGGDVTLRSVRKLEIMAKRPRLLHAGYDVDTLLMKAGRLKLDAERLHVFKTTHPALGLVLAIRFLQKNGVKIPKKGLNKWLELGFSRLVKG